MAIEKIIKNPIRKICNSSLLHVSVCVWEKSNVRM